MKITKTQLRQIIKEEVELTLKEAYGDKYITPSFRDRQWRPPARGAAPGTTGYPSGKTNKGLGELPNCLYDRNGKNLDPDNRMSWAKAAGEKLVAGQRSARCAMKRSGVAWLGEKPYEYDTFEGGIQADDDGNPKPKKF